MHRIRTALLQLAADAPSVRPTVIPVTRVAEKWQKLPKGWTEESVQKFWSSLTGENKHKVTKCIERMKDKDITDPGAFCAALADRVMGPEWRKRATPQEKQADLAGTYADFVYAGDQQFLEAVAKLIKKMAGGHAERVQVVRSGGRSPFLVYEGQDGGDMDLELTISLYPTSHSDVKLTWFGKSVMRGNISDEATFKWGMLTPAQAASVFSGLFGR